MDFFEFNIGNGSYRCIKLDTIESIELLLDSEYYDEDKRKMVKGGQVIITSFSGNQYAHLYEKNEDAQEVYNEIFNLLDAYCYSRGENNEKIDKVQQL